MKEDTELKKIFIAEDGKKFYDKEECISYEKEIKNTRYFRIIHSPDLTEGKGYYRMFFVKCNFGNESSMFVEQYCHDRFGRNYDFVMGVINLNAVMKKYIIDCIELKDLKKLIDGTERSSMLELENCVVLTLGNKGCIFAEVQDEVI